MFVLRVVLIASKLLLFAQHVKRVTLLLQVVPCAWPVHLDAHPAILLIRINAIVALIAPI